MVSFSEDKGHSASPVRYRATGVIGVDELLRQHKIRRIKRELCHALLDELPEDKLDALMHFQYHRAGHEQYQLEFEMLI